MPRAKVRRRRKPRRGIEMAEVGRNRPCSFRTDNPGSVQVLREKFEWSGEALQEAEFQINGIARKMTPAEEGNCHRR
jgi:hypothetical protein